MDALLNATVFTGDQVRQDAAVLVDQGVIAGVVGRDSVPERARCFDLDGLWLAPGFIDVQVNGGGGVLFNDAPDIAGLTRIAAAHRRLGTTGLVVTLISDSKAQRRAARQAVETAIAAGVPGILGLHLEGPHLNPARRGVHDRRWLGVPDAEDIALMAPVARGCTVVTLAPEMVPCAVIESLVRSGVRVSAGHSDASYGETRAALAAGVSGFTHLFNAMAPLGHREPGILGAALEDAESWCGIIVDGHHLHDAAVRLAWRAKRAGRLFLVSDAMPVVGSEINSFQLGDEVVTLSDGRCVTADGRLAGSGLDMASAVRHCVKRIGIPLEQALSMASLYPASFLGLEHRYGRIAPGYVADMVALDAALNLRETFVAGQPCSLA